jgi:hypothetical protein
VGSGTQYSFSMYRYAVVLQKIGGERPAGGDLDAMR